MNRKPSPLVNTTAKRKETGSSDLQSSVFPDIHDSSDDFISVCSSSDCTGLIPSMPDSDAELDSYEDMYAFCQRCVTPPEAK